MEKKPSQSMHNILKKIENLDWKIQTTSLTVQEEESLIDEVRNLEIRLSFYKQITKLEDKLLELQTGENVLETEAQTCHEKLSELAEQSQTFHEKMLKTLSKVRGLKVEADNAHQKYLQIKRIWIMYACIGR